MAQLLVWLEYQEMLVWKKLYVDMNSLPLTKCWWQQMECFIHALTNPNSSPHLEQLGWTEVIADNPASYEDHLGNICIITDGMVVACSSWDNCFQIKISTCGDLVEHFVNFTKNRCRHNSWMYDCGVQPVQLVISEINTSAAPNWRQGLNKNWLQSWKEYLDQRSQD